MPKSVVCLMGPTAVGKTATACALVQRFPMEIISIDSAMIYRGMNIGSAKPDAATLARAPHHLIDILDPTDAYSAAQCCADVQALCHSISERGHIPLLTGGTMMYFHALQQGLSTLPNADSAVREAILKEASQYGWAEMHARLANVDPLSASRIHPNDTQRIQRALEVFTITKTPLTTLWREIQPNTQGPFINLVILPDERGWLHRRIAERFQQMLHDGLIEETEQLIQIGSLTQAHPAMRCVGYRQVLGYLQGEYDKESLLEKGIAATRQLAKRQLTWLRHWPEKKVFSAEDPDMTKKIITQLSSITQPFG